MLVSVFHPEGGIKFARNIGRLVPLHDVSTSRRPQKVENWWTKRKKSVKARGGGGGGWEDVKWLRRPPTLSA
jgi:hypothetical protein